MTLALNEAWLRHALVAHRPLVSFELGMRVTTIAMQAMRLSRREDAKALAGVYGGHGSGVCAAEHCFS